MLTGVSQEFTPEFVALINRVIAFLNEVKVYFEKEVRLLEGPARAETKFVTAFIDKVALANLEKSIPRLEKLRDNNDSKTAQKLLAYVSRTQEFLAKTTQNNQDGAQFIPVPFHTKIAQENKTLLNRCNALLEGLSTFITVKPENKKSWFSYFLTLANMLPDIRAAGFGLTLENKNPAKDRLVAIWDELTELDMKAVTVNVRVTKTSQRMLACESFTSEPQSQMYTEYVPPLAQAFERFKSLMLHPPADLSKDQVHKAVEVAYPKPPHL